MKKCSDKENATLYFCVGCRTVHYDTDFSKEDGDLEITSWDLLIGSIETVRAKLNK